MCDPSKETRDGKGSGQLGKATRTGHQAFLEGRCGVVRWVAGNGRGVCWGGMSSVLCRDDRLLTQISREGLGVGPGPALTL